MLLLLTACKGDAEVGQPSTDDSVVADDSDPIPFDCPEAPAQPFAADRWSATDQPIGGGVITFAWGPGGTPIYAGSHDNGIWRSADGGLTWDSRPLRSTHTRANLAVHPTDGDTVLRSDGGLLTITHDGGHTWENLALGSVTPPPEEVWAVAWDPFDTDTIYAVIKGDGSFHVSNDAGQTFEERGAVPVPMTGPPHAGDVSHADRVWRLLPPVEPGGELLVAVGGSGLYASKDGGETWETRRTATVEAGALARDPTDPAHLVLGTTNGLERSRDGGATWTVVLSTPTRVADFQPDGTLISVDGRGLLYRDLVPEEGPFVAEPWALGVVPDGTLLLAGHDSAWTTRPGTWTEAQGMTDLGESVVAAHPACPSVVWTGTACTRGVFQSQDWGLSWLHDQNYFHYVMVIAFAASAPDTVYVTVDDVILKSTDAGGSWAEVQPRPVHYHGLAVHPTNPDIVVAGSVGSGSYNDTKLRVVRTEDGGKTWTDATGLPDGEAGSAHAMAFWPGHPDVVLLGTYKGEDIAHWGGHGVGLWRSEDGGRSFAKVDAISEVDIPFVVPKGSGMVAVGLSGLWESTDLGETWTALPMPADELWLAAAFSPVDPQVGVAFSKQFRAYVTRDGGATWTQQSAGIRLQPEPKNEQDGQWTAEVSISADGSVAWVAANGQGVLALSLVP